MWMWMWKRQKQKRRKARAKLELELELELEAKAWDLRPGCRALARSPSRDTPQVRPCRRLRGIHAA
ncbi:hypothetical protein FHY19_004506 [Xanthomonas arboricola]|nr:hypothetical protein [Xanthomonas sp. 4461]